MVVVLTLVSVLAPLSDLGLSGFVGVSGVSGSFEPSESVGPAVFTSVWSRNFLAPALACENRRRVRIGVAFTVVGAVSSASIFTSVVPVSRPMSLYPTWQ